MSAINEHLYERFQKLGLNNIGLARVRKLLYGAEKAAYNEMKDEAAKFQKIRSKLVKNTETAQKILGGAIGGTVAYAGTEEDDSKLEAATKVLAGTALGGFVGHLQGKAARDKMHELVDANLNKRNINKTHALLESFPNEHAAVDMIKYLNSPEFDKPGNNEAKRVLYQKLKEKVSESLPQTNESLGSKWGIIPSSIAAATTLTSLTAASDYANQKINDLFGNFQAAEGVRETLKKYLTVPDSTRAQVLKLRREVNDLKKNKDSKEDMKKKAFYHYTRLKESYGRTP